MSYDTAPFSLPASEENLNLSPQVQETSAQFRILWAMPRFFLHLCNGSGFVEDEEGVELSGVDAAREQAIDALRDIMAGEMRRGEINMGSFIEIEDQDRKWVMTIPFHEAVRVTTEHSQRPNRGSPAEEAGEKP